MRLDDLLLACLIFIACCVIAASVGCVSLGQRASYDLDTFVYSHDDKGCSWANGDGHILPCDDLILHDYTLVPSRDLLPLKKGR